MTLQADELGRLTAPELFPPGARFEAKREADGSIRLAATNTGYEAPLVEPIVTNEGFLMLPSKLDRNVVAAAIRADRDAQ